MPTPSITLTLTHREFFLIKDAVEDVLDECESMADCGDEWPVRHEAVKRLVERLKNVEQAEVYPH